MVILSPTHSVTMNYAYPLPKLYLHKRYDAVFRALRKRQSATIIGIPKSARSAFLKFILEYDSKFLSEFINLNENQIVCLSPEEIPDATSMLKVIAQKIINLAKNKGKFVEDIKISLKSNDSESMIFAICGYLQNNPRNKQIVFFIFDLDSISKRDAKIPMMLSRLWRVNRQPPFAPISYCFTTSPGSYYKLISSDLILPITENVIPFKLLDIDELNYTRKREHYITSKAISNKYHKTICKLSSGHHLLYKSLYHLNTKNNEDISNDEIIQDTKISVILNEIISAIDNIPKEDNLLEITGFTKNNKVQIELVNYINYKQSSLSTTEATNTNGIESVNLRHLSGTQLEILKQFMDNNEKVVSRDEIAKSIWGSRWEEKYSDWAIDQSISRLRKKIQNSNVNLYTVRNRGYLLKKKNDE